MNIAIDLDGTWTLDPHFWMMFATIARHNHHKVFIVTGRSKYPSIEELKRNFCETENFICCGSGHFKAEVMKECGIAIDIWIDNEPGTIEPQKKLSPPDDTTL